MYRVYNYRNFDDYQHGHGDVVIETDNVNAAIQCAKRNTYGGREICSVVNRTTHEEVFCTLM